MGDDKRRLNWVLIAAAAGLVLRLAFSFGYWVNQPLTRDEREYLSLARSLAAGNGFAYDTSLGDASDPFGRAPGYPLFLALTGAGSHAGDGVPSGVLIAQAVVGALGVFAVGALARRLAGSQAALVAAWIAAIHPPLVAISARAFSEAIAWPLGLAVALSFDRAIADPGGRSSRAVIAGVLTGLAVLVRPGLLFFLPLAVVWAVWRKRPRVALGCLAGAAIVLAPWTARNVAHYGRFVIVASEGGVTFWTGNHPQAIGDGDLAANPDLARAKIALRAEHGARSEEQMEPVYYSEALHWIRSNPFAWLALEARKVFYLIVPVGPSYTTHSARYYAASAIPYLAVLVLAVVGIARAKPVLGRTPGLWLLLASSVAVCLIFFPSERFRIPVIDPALIVLAGAAFRIPPS